MNGLAPIYSKSVKSEDFWLGGKSTPLFRKNAQLLAWYDSSDYATMFQSKYGNNALSSGDPVGYWLDKSGNENHLLQTDPLKKPTINKSFVATKTCLSFDGSNDSLTSEKSFSVTSDSRWCYIVAFVNISTPRGIFSHGTTDLNQVFAISLTQSTVYSDIGNNGGPYINFQPIPPTVTTGFQHVFLQWHSPGGYAQQRNCFVSCFKQLKKLRQTPGSTYLLIFNAANYGSQPFVVGTDQAYAPLNGYLCEIFYGTGLVDSDDFDRLNNYLMAKWSGNGYIF